MADPKIKIKRGTGKPPDWNGISGTTAGELYVDFTNTSFYIGNNFGQAITFGNFVDGGTLGTNSDLRVPTQKAAKTYIDAKFSSVPGLTSSDIIFIRQISSSDGVTDEESNNSIGRGEIGTIDEVNSRWNVFNFNIQQEDLANTNIFKSRGSNSVFKIGTDTIDLDGGKLRQTSGSSIKVFVSYQLSFDNFTNVSGGGYSQTSDINPARRCAIRITTYTDAVNYTEQYFLPSSGRLSGNNVLILNGSGIIEMPRWNSSGTLQAGVGFIELVWGVNGVSSMNDIFTSGNNYRYAGRSTTNSTWAPNNVTVGDLEPGYAARLIVARLPS